MSRHWLNCLIEGESIVFPVELEYDYPVGYLKEFIQSKRALDSLKDVGPHTLELWKPKDSNPIAVEPDDTLVERIGLLGHDLSKFADKLGPSRTVFSIFPTQPRREYIHIIVKVPCTTAISPSSSNESNVSGFSIHNNSGLLAGLHKLHTHLWGKDRIDHHDELACSILDLALFDVLNINTTRPNQTLLVRNEYVLAYDYIATDTLHNLTPERQRSATLVTGQPGIGKTLFLFYVLARRLHDRRPVAFQINKHKFALFYQDGVTLHPTTERLARVPEGTWALSDSDALGRSGLCMAFLQPTFQVVHTSSPSSSRWNRWVKRIGAGKYFMDVWSTEEFRTLLALNKLDVLAGEGLFEKYGPSPKTIIDILVGSIKKNTYEHEVKTVASMLAGKFSTVAPQLDGLDFTADISSKIFTVKPENNVSRGLHTLYISTPFLCRTFGLAMSRQVATQQNAFFGMLNSHPSFRAAGRWLFEYYVHNCLSVPTREPLRAHSQDGTVHCIPVPAKIIAGSTALKCIQPPHNFYWQPVNPNFKGIDAIICSGDDVWALQYIIGKEHKDATDGLIQIHDGMNHKTNVKWHLVIIGSSLTGAKAAQDDQKLDNWKWTTQVYASMLPLGQFNESHAQHLETILNNANDTDSMPDQRTHSGDPMDELL